MMVKFKSRNSMSWAVNLTGLRVITVSLFVLPLCYLPLSPNYGHMQWFTLTHTARWVSKKDIQRKKSIRDLHSERTSGAHSVRKDDLSFNKGPMKDSHTHTYKSTQTTPNCPGHSLEFSITTKAQGSPLRWTLKTQRSMRESWPAYFKQEHVSRKPPSSAVFRPFGRWNVCQARVKPGLRGKKKVSLIYAA